MLDMNFSSSEGIVIRNDNICKSVMLNNNLYIFNISSDNIDTIINDIEDNKDIIASITIHQLDYHINKNSFLASLSSLFEYMIYKNNKWSKDDLFNIIIVDGSPELEKEIKECIKKCQKRITCYDFNIFPKETCVDINVIPELIRGGDLIQREPVLTTLKIDISGSQPEIVCLEELDPTKDKPNETYVKKTYVKHEYLTYELGITTVRTMGRLTTSKNIPKGNITFDISNIEKIEILYVAKESSN